MGLFAYNLICPFKHGNWTVLNTQNLNLALGCRRTGGLHLGPLLYMYILHCFDLVVCKKSSLCNSKCHFLACNSNKNKIKET